MNKVRQRLSDDTEVFILLVHYYHTVNFSKDNRWHWVNSWKTCIHRYASPCTYRLRYSDMLLCDLALILSYLDVADDAIENVIAKAIEFLSACYLLFLVWQRQMQTSVSTLQTGRFWVTLMPHPGRVVRFQVLLDSLHPCSRWCPGGFLQFFKGEAVMIFLASVSFVVSAMWPNRERRRAWTIAKLAWLPGRPSQLVVPQMMVPFDS